MTLSTTNKLTTTVLAALACASFGCSRTDRDVNSVPPTATSSNYYNNHSGTTSGTTVAANDETSATAPAASDTTTSEAPAASSTTDTTTTKSAKRTTHTHKAKRHHMKKDSARYKAPAVVPATRDDAAVDRDTRVDDADRAANNNVHIYDNDADARPVLPQADTISGTTMAASDYRETGLSPFAQEPASHLPTQIGSGQITGEDRSTTVFDRPGMFQDPAALERDLIH